MCVCVCVCVFFSVLTILYQFSYVYPVHICTTFKFTMSFHLSLALYSMLFLSDFLMNI